MNQLARRQQVIQFIQDNTPVFMPQPDFERLSHLAAARGLYSANTVPGDIESAMRRMWIRNKRHPVLPTDHAN